MKTRLTVEQSAALIAAGVSPYLASVVEVYEGSSYTGRGAMIFNLNDLLRIIPKRLSGIPVNNRLQIEYPLTKNDTIVVRYVSYKNGNLGLNIRCKELIDGLCDMCLSLLSEGYKLGSQ